MLCNTSVNLPPSVLKKRRDVLPQTPRRFFKTLGYFSIDRHLFGKDGHLLKKTMVFYFLWQMADVVARDVPR